MIFQVQDVLKISMGLINVIEIDETPSSSEMNTAMSVANIMLDGWSSQRLVLRSTTPIEFTVTPGKFRYTIGMSGCDLTYKKPIKINSAFFRDIGNVDTQVGVITTETYNNLTDKEISTGPILYVSYDPGISQQTSHVGTISLYLAPDRNYMLHLECDQPLTEFTNLFETVSFEPVYYETFVYNLAARLFRYYHKPEIPVPADIVHIANTSFNSIKNMNSSLPIAGMDLPGKISKYNIFSDGLT